MSDAEQPKNPFDKLHTQQDALTNDMEERIGVPKGTFHNLRFDDNDWAFLIKLLALVEAAIAEVIISKIGTGDVSKFVHKLSVQGRSGKLALAESLGVLNRAHAGYVSQLADVRNDFAHSIDNIAGSLDEYVKKQSDTWRLAFARKCTWAYAGEDVSDINTDPKTWSGSLSRNLLWTGALHLFATLMAQDMEAQLQKMHRELMESLKRGGWLSVHHSVPKEVATSLGIKERPRLNLLQSMINPAPPSEPLD